VVIDVVDAHAGRALAAAAELFDEYAGSLGIDLDFQDYPQERATLPGAYGPPAGCLLLATVDGVPAGCGGLRRFAGEIAELKRMYVRPASRGLGLGRRLAEVLLARARGAGYLAIRLDTLPTMAGALALYRSLGFVDIAPYRHNPVAGAVYLELRLR
jgi:GNAT superfamily N-acetyltransferase